MKHANKEIRVECPVCNAAVSGVRGGMIDTWLVSHIIVTHIQQAYQHGRDSKAAEILEALARERFAPKQGKV